MNMKRILSSMLCMLLALTSVGITVMAQTEPVVVNLIVGDTYTLPNDITWDEDYNVDTSAAGYQLFTGMKDGSAVTYRINVGEYKVLMQDDFEAYAEGAYESQVTKAITGGTFYKSAYSENTADKKSQRLVNKDDGNTVASFGKGLSGTTDFTWTPADTAAGGAFKVSYKVKVDSFDLTEAGNGTHYFFTNSYGSTEGIHLRAKVSGGAITATELRCVGATAENFSLADYIDWKYTDESNTVAYMDEYITVELFGNQNNYSVKINGNTIAQDIQWTDSNIYKGQGIGYIIWAKRNSSTAAITYADDMEYSKPVYPTGDAPASLTATVETGTVGEQSVNFNLEMSDGTQKTVTAKYTLSEADTEQEGTISVDATAPGFNFTIPVSVSVEDAPVIIEEISDLSKTVCVGEEFTLPETVTANMSDGTTQEVAIVWNSAASTENAGVYTFTGAVEEYSGSVTYTLTVKNVIKKSVVVGKGDNFTLPSSYNGVGLDWGDTSTTVDTAYVGRQVFTGTDADGAEFIYTVNVGEQKVLVENDMESYTVGGDKPEYVGAGGLELSDDATNIVYEEGNSDNKTALISSETSWGSFKMIAPEVSENDYVISGRAKHLTTAPSSGFILVAYNGSGLEVCGIRINIDSSGGKLNIRNGIRNNLSTGANSVAYATAGKAFENLTNEWIDFSIFVDKNAGTYSVYANGHEIRLDVPFNQNAVTDPKFKSIDIVGRTGSSEETLTYIDDLKVTEYLYVTQELPGALTDSVVSGVDAERTQNISLKMNDGTMRQFAVKYTINPSQSGVQNVVGRIDGFSEEIPVTVEVDARTIESIKSESLTNAAKVFVGTDYVLPTSVIAIMSEEDESGSVEKEMNVEWDGAADTSAAGTFTFNGTVVGYSGDIVYTLTVSNDKPVSAAAISETLTLNEVYNLPSEVPVTMESGAQKNMAVNWNGAAARTDEAGTQVYTGYIVGYPELEGGDGVLVSLTLNVIASAIAAPDYPAGKTSFDIILKDIADLPDKIGCVYENGMKGFERVTWSTEAVGEGAGPFAITGTLANTDLADGFDGVVSANVSFFNVPEPALQDGLDTFTYPFGDPMFPVGITLAYQQFPSNNEASFVCVLDPDNPGNKIMKYENRPEFGLNNKFNYDALALSEGKGGFLVTEADIKLPRNFTDTRFRLLTGMSKEFIVIDFYGDRSMKVRNVDLIENVIPLEEWFTLTLVTDTTAQTPEGRYYDIYINGVYICTAPWYQEPTETNGVGKGVMRFDFRNDKDETFEMYLDNVKLYFLNDLMEEAYEAVEAVPSSVESSSITLPISAGNTTITWTSNKTDVITNEGTVTRPAYNAANANVTLTAELSQQAGIFAAGDTVTKSVRVMKVGATDSDLVNEAISALSLPSETSSDLTLRKTYGDATITWATSNSSVIDTLGRVYPVSANTDVTLTATVQCGEETGTRTFTVKVLHTDELTDIQKVRQAINSVTLPSETSEGLELPTSVDGVKVTWVSKSLSVITSSGALVSNRTSTVDATLTATFTCGDAYQTKDYIVTVKKSSNSNVSVEDSGSGGGGSGGGGGGGSKSSYVQTAPTINETPVITDGKFSDLAGYEWAKEAIETLSDKGIINGVGGNTFAPSSNIKREEFAAMIVRLAKLENADIENPFSDVTENDWFMKELNTAFANGIINGMGDGTFGAGRNITRQDMAVILLNLAKRYGIDTSNAPKPVFNDYSNISEYAIEAIDFFSSKGIINGTEGNMLPQRMATRAEAAKMIYEFIKALDIENLSLTETEGIINNEEALPEESGEAEAEADTAAVEEK